MCVAIDHQTEMSTDETDTFLRNHETGVLSLSGSDQPYAIPVSYGYDPTDRTFYTRLVSAPESEKRQYLKDGRSARLIVYVEDDEDTYRSAIASGTLSQLGPDELTAEEMESYGATKRPMFEVWNEDKDELDIDLYKLDPDTISGLIITVDRE